MYEGLKENTYENFVSQEGYELDSCVICTGEFHPKDRIITLFCNTKYIYFLLII
jgi:hypothetical protein